MIYLDNNQTMQDLYIPRQGAKSVSGSTDWASKDYVDDLIKAETARTEETYAKLEELDNYTPTSGFTTINGHSITDGGDIVIEGTDYRGGDNIEISGNTISVTGIPTTFKTINGSAITGNGDITIEGKVYSAGTNISIEDEVISVTGITVPTKVSDLQNDAGYITEHQSLSAYSTTEQVENMVSAATAATTGWVEDQHYLTEHQDLSAYTPTSGFSTVNGSAITEGGNITINASATVRLTQAQYDALETKDDGTIYVITDAPTIDIDDLSSKRLEALDEFPSSPVEGDVVNMADGLWKYKENPVWGTWIGLRAVGGGDGIGGGRENMVALDYDYLPEELDGKIIAKLSYYSGNGYGNDKWIYFDLTNMVLKVYLNNSADISTDTPTETIALGGDVQVSNFGIGSMRIKWDGDHKSIIFYDATYNIVKDPISVSRTGYGWEKVARNDYYCLNSSDVEQIFKGYPKWDKNGNIVGKDGDVNTTAVKINNTGYTNTFTIVQKGANNVPGAWFFPTSGGQAGQVLVSNGNSEPVWSTMIKAVKITSAEYDALVQAGTTDANTLYLIADE